MFRHRCETEKETSNEDDFCDEVVKVSGTDIFFYSGVNSSSVSKLNFVLRKLEKELLIKAIEYPGYEPRINIYIKSEGGDIFEGFSAMDHIENTKLHVTTIADGCCASAATFMFLAGHTREMNQHAFLLIHQISMDGIWGKYEEIKQEVQNSDKFMETIKNIYREKTKIPTKKLDEFMKKDVYLSAQDCTKYGII